MLMILMHKNLFIVLFYPGNMLDYTAFRDFLRTYKIKNGFLILDRGFDDKECKNLMREKNIKYLMPIKINHTFKKFNLKIWI